MMASTSAPRDDVLMSPDSASSIGRNVSTASSTTSVRWLEDKEQWRLEGLQAWEKRQSSDREHGRVSISRSISLAEQEARKRWRVGVKAVQAANRFEASPRYIRTPSQEVRRDLFGSNTYPEKPARSFFSYLWDATGDTTLRILAVAVVVSLIVGMTTEGASHGWYDGAGIGFAIIIVLLLQAGNDYHQAAQFRDLNRKKKNIPIEVTRGGRRLEISIYDLVVGDLVHVNLGDQVPADGVIVESVSLVADEASMTGESDPLSKDAIHHPFLISGTKVIEGYGTMIVTAVGMNTEWGRVMATVSEDSEEETPLQIRLETVALGIGKIGLSVAIIVFIVLNIRFLATVNFHDFGGEQVRELIDFFAIAVTIVVVAVPEGLPLAVTLSLAYSMRKMMADKALVRHLSACETMGGATAICSDKTGTLTTNKMVVVKAWIFGGMFAQNITPASLPDIARTTLIEGMALNSNGSVFLGADGAPEISGKPTETAVLAYGLQLGMNFDKERAAAKILKVDPFNSAKKRMGVLMQRPDGSQRVHWKGATEIVLSLCDTMVTQTGKVVPLTKETRAGVAKMIDEMASESLRTLCLAFRDLPQGSPEFVEPLPTDTPGELSYNECEIPDSKLTCMALVGIKDPPRPGVGDAVKRCQAAGITVRMVTGDYIVTAKAIAREVNILTPGGIAMEGPVFRQMTREEMTKVIPKLQVLARSSPSDKYTLVKYLREAGEVVAVTGDGTNDAPALKEADIGLSMGIAGTEIAKEASDVIILDDNFASIVKVVRWGRSVFENIRKFVQFQLTVNVVALALNFTTAIITGHAPLDVVQLLWVNLIMDSMGALALGTEAPTDRLMERKPYGRLEPLMSNVMWRNLAVASVYEMAILLTLFFGSYKLFDLEGWDPAVEWDPATDYKEDMKYINRTMARQNVTFDEAEALSMQKQMDDDRHEFYIDRDKHRNTIIFNTFVFLQVFNELNARDMTRMNIFRGLFTNKIFMCVIIFTVSCQYVIVEFLNDFASTTGLPWKEWIVSVALGCSMLPVGMLGKLIPVPETPNFADVVTSHMPSFCPSWLFGKKAEEEKEAMYNTDISHEDAQAAATAAADRYNLQNR
eukprot:jgi/Mesvir1/13072/Mv06058-RA.1